MEDFFRIIPNINGTDVSIYGVFDGHAGDFASKYSCDIIMPSIADKISSVMNLVQQKIKPLPKDVEIDPGDSPIADPLEVYITNDNKINYELLLRDEILEADKILNERLAKAVQFCGTTFCVVLVDISNNMILCANVGDSRAILCNTRAIAVQLSFDHKPNNPEELKRIHDNGGFVSKKEGCWRVEGSLATSRTLGDYPLKAKKVLTAEPDIKIMKYKEFKFFPKFILIASDGVWDVISNQSASDYVKLKLKEPEFGARNLVTKAYARRSEDNITAIVIKFIKPKKVKERSSFDPYTGTYEWLR